VASDTEAPAAKQSSGGVPNGALTFGLALVGLAVAAWLAQSALRRRTG
jgi:hypothetical protein